MTKKRFIPAYVKRSHERRSGLGQTGAHGTSHRIAPPDAHRLGNLPQDWPRSGQNGQYTSSIMGRMGTGSLSHYTDEDVKDFEKMSGPPGKSGNYKDSTTRVYVKKGGGKGMIGASGIHESKEEAILRELIREIIKQEKIFEKKKITSDVDAYSYELMRASDGEDEEDEAKRKGKKRRVADEVSVAAGVAGYSLPLGMSNRNPGDIPPWKAAAKAYGNANLGFEAKILAKKKK